MKRNRIRIRGMPYMPGTARGKVHRGTDPEPGQVALYIPLGGQPPAATAVAIIVVEGAPFSHAMIRLRARGVPMVVIDLLQAAQLEDGMEVVVDGILGMVTAAAGQQAAQTLPPAPDPGRPLRLASGEHVQLLASVSDRAGAQAAVACGAGAIGLLRSELLLPPGNRIPNAAFYRKAIGDISAAAAPLPVTVRLLDISPDKAPAWLPASTTDGDVSGLQGVRVFRNETARRVLDAQLAALDDLKTLYDLRVLLPATADHAETGHWTGYVRERLKNTETGAMAETPAAVLDMHRWFDSADFVAVGCNDLMQCLFGADRERPELRDYLDPYAPALFRLLKDAAELAAGNLDRVRLCGLLPQLHGVLPVLIGLGYRAFSVDPWLVPWLAETVRKLAFPDTQTLARQACEAADSKATRELVTGTGTQQVD